MSEISLEAPIKVGARSSGLARTQALRVAEALVAAGCHQGYQIVDIGGMGGDPSQFAGGRIKTDMLRQSLRDQEVDVAVHMLADLPLTDAPGLVVAAYLPRDDPRDALIARDGATIATLPFGARIGISSPLRRAQLLQVRPDLSMVGMRGQLDSRMAKVASGDLEAIILARSVLVRDDFADAVTELIDPQVMVPRPTQGILVVETRVDADPALLRSLARIDHFPTRVQAAAERELEGRLAQVSRAPVGGLASFVESADGSRSRFALSAIVCGPTTADDLRVSQSVTVDDLDTQADLDAMVAAATRLGADVADELTRLGAESLPEHLLEKPHLDARPRVMVPHLNPASDELLAAAIGAAGGEPMFVTMTQTNAAPQEYLDQVLDALPKADRVGITSAEAVELLSARAEARGSSLSTVLDGTPVAAFGGGVCSALATAGVTVDMLPSLDSSVGNLLSVWPPAEADEQPVAMLAGSANASPLLAAGLRDVGWEVQEFPVYDRVTVVPTTEHEDVLAEGWPEAVVIWSRSAAKAVEDLFGVPPKAVRVVACGKIVARDAQALGMHVDAIAPSMKPSVIAATALDGLGTPSTDR